MSIRCPHQGLVRFILDLKYDPLCVYVQGKTVLSKGSRKTELILRCTLTNICGVCGVYMWCITTNYIYYHTIVLRANVISQTAALGKV